MLDFISFFNINDKSLKVPLFANLISAGFPSPAQDFVENRIDLNEILIKHPSATYLLRVSGESMINGHIQHDDLLIVDSAKEAKHGDIVIASVLGEFTVKKLCVTPKLFLEPMNDKFKPIEIKDANDLNIFGVVTYIIHKA